MKPKFWVRHKMTNISVTKINSILSYILLLASCSTNSGKQRKVDIAVKDTLTVSANSSHLIRLNHDTLMLTRRAAVCYQPDTNQIKKRKKEVGEENFMVGADDYLFYMNAAQEFFDSIKLGILNAQDHKYLKFIRTDQSFDLIKLDTLHELWGVYLFDPLKKPRLVDMTDIKEEYKNYYR